MSRHVESVQHYAAGSEEQTPLPGDFLLTHAGAWTSRLIRFGEGLRFRGDDAKYAYWSHAVCVVGEDGAIVEALGAGVRKGNISDYKGQDYAYVRMKFSKQDRRECADYALSTVGHEYGYLTDISLGINCITGGKFTFMLNGEDICSGIVADMLERGGVIWEQNSATIMPADLAKRFQVVKH